MNVPADTLVGVAWSAVVKIGDVPIESENGKAAENDGEIPSASDVCSIVFLGRWSVREILCRVLRGVLNMLWLHRKIPPRRRLDEAWAVVVFSPSVVGGTGVAVDADTSGESIAAVDGIVGGCLSWSAMVIKIVYININDKGTYISTYICNLMGCGGNLLVQFWTPPMCSKINHFRSWGIDLPKRVGLPPLEYCSWNLNHSHHCINCDSRH